MALMLSEHRIEDILETMGSLAVYLVVCVALLLASYWLLDILTPGKLTQIIKQGGWNAALLASANLFAVALIILFAFLGQPVTINGIVTSTVFAVAGAIFQAIGLWIIRRIWLAKDDLQSVLASPVSPTGIFLASASLALGLAVGVAVY